MGTLKAYSMYAQTEQNMSPLYFIKSQARPDPSVSLMEQVLDYCCWSVAEWLVCATF